MSSLELDILTVYGVMRGLAIVGTQRQKNKSNEEQNYIWYFLEPEIFNVVTVRELNIKGSSLKPNDSVNRKSLVYDALLGASHIFRYHLGCCG